MFLLLLRNDQAVLSPWVNGRWTNLFTGAVVAAPVFLSVILTAAVLYPDISDAAILWTLGIGAVLAMVVAGITLPLRPNGQSRYGVEPADTRADRETWRMPPLGQLPPARLTSAKRTWLAVLRLYLIAASIMVVVRVVQITLGQE